MKTKWFIAIGVLINVAFLAYFFSFHRIGSISSIQKVARVSQLPVLEGNSSAQRCRLWNVSHSLCLPNIFFIGASKAATTSIVSRLRLQNFTKFMNRRAISVDRHSEVHRFDRSTFSYSMKWIEHLDELACSPHIPNAPFPPESYALIHYTPHYLFSPSVPFDVRKFFTYSRELRFLVSLRDPISRSLSSYWFHNSHLFNAKDRGSIEDFETNCRVEINRRIAFENCMCEQMKSFMNVSNETETFLKENSFQNMIGSLNICYFSRLLSLYFALRASSSSRAHASWYQKRDRLYHSYEQCMGHEFRSSKLGHRHLEKSIYVDQLLRWLINFPFPSHFHIISFENWSKDPSSEFLGIMDFFSSSFFSSSPSPSPSSNISAFSSSFRMNSFSGKITEKMPLDNPYFFDIGSISFNISLLNRPNSLANTDLTFEFRDSLESFFDPYNRLLGLLLNISLF